MEGLSSVAIKISDLGYFNELRRKYAAKINREVKNPEFLSVMLKHFEKNGGV